MSSKAILGVSIKVDVNDIESIEPNETGSVLITFKQVEPEDNLITRQFPQHIYVDKSFTIVITENNKLLIEK